MDEIGLHTLGDVADVHVIYAHSGLTIPELRERLTCARCGERRHEIRIVFSLPAR